MMNVTPNNVFDAVSNVNNDGHDVFGLRMTDNEKALRSMEAPAATETWQPMSHDHFITMVEENIADRGMTVTRKNFTSTAEGNRAFGMYVIGSELSERGDAALMLGIRHSMNKTLSAALAIGHHVFVCSNGMFVGEHILGRRHTKNIISELPALIAAQLDKFPQHQRSMFEYNEHLRKVEVKRGEFAELAVKMARCGALPKGKILDVCDEFESDEHIAKHGAETAWSALNAATELLKPRLAKNSVDGSEQTLKLHRLFEGLFPLIKPTAVSVAPMLALPAPEDVTIN
jgi:hypothetical protein